MLRGHVHRLVAEVQRLRALVPADQRGALDTDAVIKEASTAGSGAMPAQPQAQAQAQATAQPQVAPPLQAPALNPQQAAVAAAHANLGAANLLMQLQQGNAAPGLLQLMAAAAESHGAAEPSPKN